MLVSLHFCRPQGNLDKNNESSSARLSTHQSITHSSLTEPEGMMHAISLFWHFQNFTYCIGLRGGMERSVEYSVAVLIYFWQNLNTMEPKLFTHSKLWINELTFVLQWMRGKTYLQKKCSHSASKTMQKISIQLISLAEMTTVASRFHQL